MFRSMSSTLPYKEIPAWMIKELVDNCIMWFIKLPPKWEASIEYIPQTLMKGMVIDFNNNCNIEFGDIKKNDIGDVFP